MPYDSWELLQVSKDLISSAAPSDSHVSRAISTAYYAIFQHVCCASADLLLGGQDTYLTRAKNHLTRSIAHKALIKRMGVAQNSNIGFPPNLVTFANTYCLMQKRREDADYDRDNGYTVADANLFIAETESAMTDFDGIQKKHRKAFLVWSIIDHPKR